MNKRPRRSAAPAPVPQRLSDLDTAQQKHVILVAAGRTSIGIVILALAYTLVPVRNEYGVHPLLMLAGLVVIFGLVLWFALRNILKDPLPQVRAAQSIALTVTFYVFMFSALYLAMSILDPNHFDQPLTHISSFYFTITTLTTVGYGDIHANDDTTRLIVSLQMILNLLLIYAVIKLIVGVSKHRLAKADRDKQQ
jgi:hypothetical protein